MPTIDDILSHLDGVKKNGRGWKACCPGHDDKRPSLDIDLGDDGRVLLCCRAGCNAADIVTAMGLSMSNLFPDTPAATKAPAKQPKTYESAESAIGDMLRWTNFKGGRHTGSWDYFHPTGAFSFRVVRIDFPDSTKQFRPLRQQADGKWELGDPPGKLPLYRVLKLAEADCVYVVEGEKAVDAAIAIGLVATTSAHGSKSAKKTDWSPLRGKQVVILPDNDRAGREYAETVAGILTDLSCEVRIVTLPGLPDGGDVVDHVDRLDSKDGDDIRRGVEELVTAATVWKPDGVVEPTFQILPYSQLADGLAVDWLWTGYLAAEHITLLVGLWKAGKTTLVSHLIRCCQTGGDLAGRVMPCRTLVVSEESPTLWRRRRDELKLDDSGHVLLQPFLTKPALSDWLKLLDHIEKAVADFGYRAVIIDALTTLWSVGDENDAVGCIEALMPLRALCRRGVGVLLVHHPRKGDAGEGQAARGSGAVPGFCDTIVELRRYRPADPEDCRRTLRCYSRFSESIPEQVVELADDGYHVLGTTAQTGQRDREAVIFDLLPSEPPGIQGKDILSAWPDDDRVKPSLRAIQRTLKRLGEAGQVVATGRGVCGDPMMFYRMMETKS